MGWDYVKGWTKADLVANLIKPENFSAGSNAHSSWIMQINRKTLAHCCLPQRGCSSDPSHVLWQVIRDRVTNPAGEVTEEKYILCTLLQPGYGGYGYKSIMEKEGPYYWDCPVEYLDMVPVANQEWRDCILLKERKSA